MPFKCGLCTFFTLLCEVFFFGLVQTDPYLAKGESLLYLFYMSHSPFASSRRPTNENLNEF